MTKKLLIGGLALNMFVVVACSNNRDQNSGVEVSQVSVAAVMKSDLSNTKKAEELASQAEELFSAQGFEEASKVAKLALKQDPKNLKAGFFNAFLDVLMELKGLTMRTKPLATRTAQGKIDFEENIAELEAKGDTALSKFYLDGKPDIHTEAQFQKQMDQIALQLQKLSQFLKSTGNAELTIKANTVLVPDINKRFADACEIKESEELVFELVCPPSENRHLVTLNQADFSNLKDFTAATQIMMTMYTAYDISGVTDLAVAQEKNPEMTPEQNIKAMLKNPNFAKLRAQSQLKNIKTWGLDMTSGLRWAMENQATLCKSGTPSGTNRPGMFANQGICLDAALNPYITNIEDILNGKPQDIENKSDDGTETYASKVTPMNFLNNPLSDLRKLGPFKYNKCGFVVAIEDQSAGGIYPAKDANKILALNAKPCE